METVRPVTEYRGYLQTLYEGYDIVGDYTNASLINRLILKGEELNLWDKNPVIEEQDLLRLSDNDKDILKSIGYIDDKEYGQIEKALKVVKCMYIGRRMNDQDAYEISVKQARYLLGDEMFLSGMGRCTFHQTAMRKCEDGTEVFFQAYLRDYKEN